MVDTSSIWIMGTQTEKEGVSGSTNPEMPLHKEMIQLFREFKLTLLPHGKEVLGILESFRVEVSEGNEACSECGGSGEGEPGEDCFNCGGSGEQEADGSILNQDESHKLDDRYYAINEVWMAELNQHLGQWFATGQDPFANETAPKVAEDVYQTPTEAHGHGWECLRRPRSCNGRS